MHFNELIVGGSWDLIDRISKVELSKGNPPRITACSRLRACGPSRTPPGRRCREQVQRYLACFLLSAFIISCDDTSAPEPAIGYFIVDSLFVTFVVNRSDQEQIMSNVDVRYEYHFEKSRGYISCQGIKSVFQDEYYRHCFVDPIPRSTDYMLEDSFGIGTSADYSYLDSTNVSIRIEGVFTGGQCYDFQSARCNFVWEKNVIVPVENELE